MTLVTAKNVFLTYNQKTWESRFLSVSKLGLYPETLNLSQDTHLVLSRSKAEVRRRCGRPFLCIVKKLELKF